MLIYMKIYRNIFIMMLCGVFLPNAALADCANPTFRKNNPSKCQSFAGMGTLAMGGGALALGGVAVLALGSGGASGGGHSVPMATLPTYTHVGADVDSTHLSAVMNSDNYIMNFEQYNDIRLAYSVARGYTGVGSTIAVVDTGPNHWHGASVAAIAGDPIAPNAKIEYYQITSKSTEFLSYHEIGNVISGIKTADIINNSWNATKSADTIYSREQLAALTDNNFINSISASAARGAIFVWAAGNEGAMQSGALSAMPRVMPELSGHFINVVAWDSATGALADYSNACGVTKNYCITAPGTDLDTGERNVSGTSFAAPVVSAAVAVIREAFPYMAPDEITKLLFTTARDLGTPGIDEIYGWGMLDLERATRPVGAPLVPLDENMMQPLRTARLSGAIGHKIQSANLKLAYFDSFGRAFETRLNDNISVKNRGLGFDRLRGRSNMSVRAGNLEFGFSSGDFISGDGFLKTDGKNTVTFIAANNTFYIGDAEIFQRTQIGKSSPHPAPESMITEFSDVYVASMDMGLRMHDWVVSISVPDTIIGGTMRLRLPTGRDADGTIRFHDYEIDMTSRPALEYGVEYKFLRAAFVDNPRGTDEFYIIAKTKISF